jgi:hypothetical protein
VNSACIPACWVRLILAADIWPKKVHLVEEPSTTIRLKVRNDRHSASFIVAEAQRACKLQSVATIPMHFEGFAGKNPQQLRFFAPYRAG